MDAPGVALVTGSSTGFGRLIAETLARKGYSVFASMRDSTGRNMGHLLAVATLDATRREAMSRACKLRVESETLRNTLAGAVPRYAPLHQLLLARNAGQTALPGDCCQP